MEKNDRHHEDVALCEALSRMSEQAQKESMTDDFEQQVMNKIVSSKSSERMMRAAAVFIGLLLVSCIAWAAWQLSNTNDKKTSSVNEQTGTTIQLIEAQDDIIRFDNVELDSVLTVVADHYCKTVEFRNEPVRHLRFLIEWNREAPLSKFVELINNFEWVHVVEENDTIFAE